MLVYVSYPKHVEDLQSARFNEAGFDQALLALQEVCNLRVVALIKPLALRMTRNQYKLFTILAQLMPRVNIILRCKAANLYRKYGEFQKESDQPRRSEDLKPMIMYWTTVTGPMFASREDLQNALQKGLDPENRCRYIQNLVCLLSGTFFN